MTKLRIFLADDHAIVREGLKALVNAQPDMEVIGEAADGRAAWEQAKACQPDIVVMDLSMPNVEWSIGSGTRCRASLSSPPCWSSCGRYSQSQPSFSVDERPLLPTRTR